MNMSVWVENFERNCFTFCNKVNKEYFAFVFKKTVKEYCSYDAEYLVLIVTKVNEKKNIHACNLLWTIWFMNAQILRMNANMESTKMFKANDDGGRER